MSNKPFVGFKDAAAQSGLSVYWWRKAVADNRVPYIRSGNKVYIDFERAIAKIREGEAG